MTDLSEITVELDCDVWTFPNLNRSVIVGSVDSITGGSTSFVHSIEEVQGDD